MKTLTNYKINQLTKFNQLILLDYKGFVVQSCDSIFSTTSLKDSPIQNKVVFIESIFNSLVKLKPSDPEIRFTKVEIPANFLPGYYDFTFSSVLLDKEKYILWSIFDYTDLYLDLMKYQQRKNELEIRRQAFELQNKNLKSPNDILLQQNFFLDYFEATKEKEFSTKLQELLLSQENALDTLSILTLANNKDENLFNGLQGVFSELSAIKEELNIFLRDGINEGSSNDRFSISSIIEEVINLINNELSILANINYTIHENVPAQMKGYASAIKQILFSLFTNFFEQNEDTKIDVYISNTLIQDTRQVLNVTVSEEIAKESNTSIQKPTGLILRVSLMKKLAEMCKGKIIPIYDLASPFIRINLQIPVKTDMSSDRIQ